VNWLEFEAAVPELAALGRRRSSEGGLVLVGTLRRDGWPWISPVEPYFVDGELMLGMMWRSPKALDLLRDPRLVVHSTVSDREGTEGDFKLYGTAANVADPALVRRYGDATEAAIGWRPTSEFHLFAVDVERAGYVVFGEERYGLAWDPDGGLRRWAIPEV
jgi:hypothetical protein